ncbi:hypothetical protein [Paraburkholderia aromaticivorans]|uniref:hypothetical protein n=1 Tax=Paraburkholderia aromaticivorans TaxID=2026199 RepID=UPI0012FE4C7E|nr:hypothetical protein [Paraburkholderia aromaticivorans]
MKKIALHRISLIAGLAIVAATSAVSSASVAFYKGYQRGSDDGKLEAARNSASALTRIMTSGINVRQLDGTDKRYILTPVEAQPR